jgi:hypothetical protein
LGRGALCAERARKKVVKSERYMNDEDIMKAVERWPEWKYHVSEKKKKRKKKAASGRKLSLRKKEKGKRENR